MGILKYLKDVLRGKENKYTAWLTDSAPIFTSFGKNVYLSDFVNNAIDRIASEVSKINLQSVVVSGDTIQTQNDDITRLFRFKPNPLQTTSDFFSSVEWLRRKNCNAFIYPQYEILEMPNGRKFKRYKAFYPLNPQAIYIGVKNGAAWEVRMDFEDGSTYIIPYSELIHIRWRRGSNTIVGGGNDFGLSDETALRQTVDALEKTIQGLPKSIEASLQIKGVYSAKALVDSDKLSAIRNDFENHVFTSKAGIAAIDLGGEFTPVNIKAAEIPADALKFLKAVIEERYGVSAAILSGDYNGEQHSAFYQTAIEDFIVQIEQAFSACVFTPRELDVGHRVKCYYKKVSYLTTQSKLALADLATKTRLMTLNQIADMFGVEPFDGGDVRLQSLNYVESGLVNEYQSQKAGAKEEPPLKEDQKDQEKEEEEETSEEKS